MNDYLFTKIKLMNYELRNVLRKKNIRNHLLVDWSYIRKKPKTET